MNSAFSIIFKKSFVVFERDDHPEMSERIVSLTSLFRCEERYCNNSQKKNLQYIETLNNRNIEYKTSEFDILQKESKRILDI